MSGFQTIISVLIQSVAIVSSSWHFLRRFWLWHNLFDRLKCGPINIEHYFWDSNQYHTIFSIHGHSVKLQVDSIAFIFTFITRCFASFRQWLPFFAKIMCLLGKNVAKWLFGVSLIPKYGFQRWVIGQVMLAPQT